MVSLIPLALLAFVNLAHSMELVAVQSIFRHGDRAPSNPLPKGQIGLEQWPNGWSQLTELGAAQTRELGTYYRRQYAKKLQLLKNADRDIYVRSSSKTRAIESAQNMLNGLFDRNEDLPEIHVNGEYKQDLVCF
jgi:broad specificity phosphatase PhoE